MSSGGLLRPRQRSRERRRGRGAPPRDIGKAFRRTIELDGPIERTVRAAGARTLVIFTADHSYDLVSATGPGSEHVGGFSSNTQLFDVTLDAFGWKPSPLADR